MSHIELIQACSMGNLDEVRSLVEARGDILNRNLFVAGKHMTFFHIAMASNCLELLDYLVEIGLEPDFSPSEGVGTPVQYAITQQTIKFPTIHHLIDKHKVDPKVKKLDGSSMLHLAVAHARVDIIDYAIKCGISIEDTDINGVTPFITGAITHNHHKDDDILDIMAYLVDYYNANINATDKSGSTALHYAIGNPKLVAFLDQIGINHTIANKAGLPALALSIMTKKFASMDRYAEREREKPSQIKRTLPKSKRLTHEWSDFISGLTIGNGKQKKDKNDKTKTKSTTSTTTSSSTTSTSKTSKSTDTKNDSKSTPTTSAPSTSTLSSTPTPSQSSSLSSSTTPTSTTTTTTSSSTTTSRRIKKKSFPERKAFENPALDLSEMVMDILTNDDLNEEQLDTAKTMLLFKADMTHIDEDGYTLLHYVVECGSTHQVFDLILEMTEDKNMTSNDGYTPLDLAIMNNDPEIIQKLQNCGCITSNNNISLKVNENQSTTKTMTSNSTIPNSSQNTNSNDPESDHNNNTKDISSLESGPSSIKKIKKIPQATIDLLLTCPADMTRWGDSFPK